MFKSGTITGTKSVNLTLQYWQLDAQFNRIFIPTLHNNLKSFQLTA
jgi:hypothetical protein